MSRRARIVLISVGSVIALLVIAVVAVVWIGNSDWLREKFRQRIVAEAMAATGGRVEIGAFKLDWRTLTAELDNVVLHGKEPPGTASFPHHQAAGDRLPDHFFGGENVRRGAAGGGKSAGARDHSGGRVDEPARAAAASPRYSEADHGSPDRQVQADGRGGAGGAGGQQECDGMERAGRESCVAGQLQSPGQAI